MSIRSHVFCRWVPMIFATAILAACGGGGSGGSQSKASALTIGITDAPVDMAHSVYIQFSGVELKPKAGAAFSIDFDTPKNIDLLALQGGNRALLLDHEKVPAGEYEWMRLKVNADPNVGGDSYLMLEGGMQCEMRIPSGDQTGLKLIRGFTVGVGAITDFTIDFDLRKSIVAPPGQNMPGSDCGGQVYMLKPVLRVVDSLQVGAVSGLVDANLVAAQCASPTTRPYPGNVYLYQVVAPATDVTPDDYDGVPDDVNGPGVNGSGPDINGPDPIASAMVDPATFRYTIGFVPVGSYEVAYTCNLDDVTVDADLADAPAGADEVVTLTPEAGIPVTVTANQTTTVDFPPSGG